IQCPSSGFSDPSERSDANGERRVDFSEIRGEPLRAWNFFLQERKYEHLRTKVDCGEDEL
ncbi:hypothetical protein D4R89_07325, partial [bacterium]